MGEHTVTVTIMKFCSPRLLKGATATNRNENDLLQHDHRGAKGHLKKTHSQLQLSISQTRHHIASNSKSGPGGELTKDAEHRKRRKNLSFVCTAETRRRCTYLKCPP